MADKSIAFYPGETPLFEGEVSVASVPGKEQPTTHVTVEGQPSLDLEIISQKEKPIRTVHSGYFTRHGESAVRFCNVDLELDEQPSIETVARAILAIAPEDHA